MEAAVGFALGAVGGCILGLTEDPVDQTLTVMTAVAPLKPLMDEVRTVGALGLGTLMGATALTTAMTSVVAGVILSAVLTTVFVATRSCSPTLKDSAGLWISAGVAGAFGTSLSGATLGISIEWIVKNYGMVGLLFALLGGPLVRRAAGEVKVIVGAALVAGVLLAGVEVLTPILGEGGKAGALLGVVGAAGVSVGAAAAVAGRWSSWAGTLGTIAGLVLGALVLGKWHIVNIGLQVPVAYVFAMTNPF
ncbi:hypothetical protein KUCAC02_013867 [Chaenocephalus aceratus]|uniref:Uncharacterized protein n=1 Tax=Chaenocephalus aceratus TaxID=36190 RepID=A0ACB9WC44_CHAAC|nr:hypothetical protein KUCAC02_013867 [Chaenocephalus aceratus]